MALRDHNLNKKGSDFIVQVLEKDLNYFEQGIFKVGSSLNFMSLCELFYQLVLEDIYTYIRVCVYIYTCIYVYTHIFRGYGKSGVSNASWP